MAIPGNGADLPTANIYQLTAPGSLNAQATIDTALAGLGGLGSGLFLADQLALSSNTTFSTTTVNGVTTESITYADASAPGGTVTIPGVTLLKEGSSGFTFSSSNGGTYYLSNQPIGGTQVDVNTSNNGLLIPLRSTLDGAVGPNPTLFVGATNTPSTLDGNPYVPCFVRGTRIATPGGNRAVEDLEIGDLVITGTSGEAKPVLWVGRRSYAPAFVGRNQRLVPIRIAADAIETNRPTRDLWLSPCHALLIDGMLIPAAELVNGLTITQPQVTGVVDYFHVEIEDHDAILAEGVACETFVDHDSRMAFQNVSEYLALYPDREDAEPVFCAPRVVDGPELQAVRERLEARAQRMRLQDVA